MIYLTVNDRIAILPFSVRLYNGLYGRSSAGRRDADQPD